MDLIWAFSRDVKEGKMRQLQTWLDNNEERVAELAPEGTEYLGSYVAAQSSEKGMGELFTLWRMDSYGAQDKLAAQQDTELGQLFHDYFDFLDHRNEANWGSILLKRMTDASLWGSDV